MEFFKLCLSCMSLCLWLQVIEGQSFMIKNVLLEKCIHVTPDSGRVSMAECKPHSHHQQWFWDPDMSALVSAKSKRCLTVQTIHEFSSMKLESCENNEHQAWTCDKRGHLTLQDQGLHLSIKRGTKKVYVSKVKDKLSKWKTMMDGPVCKGGAQPTEQVEQKKHELEEVPVEVYESKFVSSTAKVKTLSSSPWVDATSFPTQLPGLNNTSRTTDNVQFIASDKDGRWKTAMLILSPFAFMLGVIILALNIRYNKKRKLLSALPRYTKSVHKVGSSYERSPLTDKEDILQNAGQAPHSPSLRHGEILIEWKDGTVTPLFDHQPN
ncbi:uncharacterized protein LOC142479229 isoform X2 [Ascaphus truei]|uniref:uncharacterized protein LOC142479229 isoform X2 n=1 Tax=Ascaphus truei TaxID=8439 RepID=UPI003F5AB2F8